MLNESVNLGNVLFAIRSRQPLSICNANVGATFVAPAGKRLVRPSTARGGCKISNIAYALEKVAKGEIKGNRINNCILFSINEQYFSVERTTVGRILVNTSGDKLHGVDKAIPLLLLYMNESPDTYPKILIETFNTFGEISPGSIAALCDDIYYTFNGDIGSVEQLYEDSSFEAKKKMLMQLVKTPIEGLNPLTSNNEVKLDDDGSDFFNEIKEGHYKLERNWGRDKKNIPDPSFLNSYVPNDAFYSLVNKIKYRLDTNRKFVNCFLCGRPGTGKTKTAYAAACALGMPIYTVALSKNTEEDEFQGKNKFVDGKLQFVETDFLKAFRKGGIIVLEEINLADPGVIMGALGQALEAPYIIMKDGYEKIERHPDTVIIGTFNVGTYGSRGINQALSSRIRQTYILDSISDADAISILMGNVVGTSKKMNCPKPVEIDEEMAKNVYNTYNKIINYCTNLGADDEIANLSIRACQGALEEIEEGTSFVNAIRNSILGKIAETNLELARDVETSCL